LASGQAFAATITSTGTGGNWNTPGTWAGNVVPVADDDVIIAAGHTVIVDANVSVASITTATTTATLNFATNATPYTLNVSSTVAFGGGGIQNSGTFNATNAGAITSAATVAGNHGIRNTGTFTMGSGTLTATASGGVGIENEGTGIFTGGTGLITAGSFRNGNSGTPSFTVGSGGMTVTSTYYPNSGTIVLNGNLAIRDTNNGTATVSGAGKMILTDAGHVIGTIKVHNLETAAFTAARTITLTGTVTATGTTKLNGSAAGAITISKFSGSGTFTPATTAYHCDPVNTNATGITCNTSAPPLSTPVNAPVDLHFSKQVETFATEINLK